MPRVYKAISGDDFSTISRKVYGDEHQSELIKSANPGVDEDFIVAGLLIDIPDLPGEPENVFQDAPASTQNEVAILVDGKRFRFWDSIRVTRSIDSIDTVEFGAPFGVDLPNFKETFVPFSYKPMEVTVGGRLLFKGTMVSITPAIDKDKKIIVVSAYSLPGVLNDCVAPISAFPLEFRDMGLKDIAKRLAAPFGIGVTFTSDEGEKFGGGSILGQVAIQPNERVLFYLSKLAEQRELIISNTVKGELLFLKSVDTGSPVANLSQGASPLLSVVPTFSPQDYFSSITAVPVVIIGGRGEPFTQQNERLPGVIRPFTFEIHDTITPDLVKAVAAKMGRMFANMVSYSVDVSTWRDKDENLWKPNTIINLHAPDAMIYNPFEFLIRSVDFSRDAKREVATLNLVLLGAFSGKAPEVFPWED